VVSDEQRCINDGGAWETRSVQQAYACVIEPATTDANSAITMTTSPGSTIGTCYRTVTVTECVFEPVVNPVISEEQLCINAGGTWGIKSYINEPYACVIEPATTDANSIITMRTSLNTTIGTCYRSIPVMGCVFSNNPVVPKDPIGIGTE